MRNRKIYDVAINHFLENNVPPSTAQKAAEVVANDDPSKPNFDRTEEDTRVVKDAVIWMNTERISFC